MRIHSVVKFVLTIPVVAILALTGSLAIADTFDTDYAAADAKRSAAAELGYEWRDTAELLEQAKEANAAGEADKANKLVAMALEQSNDAIAQAERESTAWQHRVPQ